MTNDDVTKNLADAIGAAVAALLKPYLGGLTALEKFNKAIKEKKGVTLTADETLAVALLMTAAKK